MRHFAQLGEWDAAPLYLALLRRPEVWNRHRLRTTYENTPHTEVDDVLLRYPPPDVTEPEVMANAFGLVTYPAWHELPEARMVIFNLMHRVEGVALGRVVISRLPPGGKILPHADVHGAYVNAGARFHAVVHGLPGSKFHGGGETVEMRTGTVWWFDHKAMHAVENQSSDDRIHLMIDIATIGWTP